MCLTNVSPCLPLREITALCNGLTYGGRLECGSEEVSLATLFVPKMSSLGLPPESWPLKALSGNLALSVVFLCTDGAEAGETSASGISNELEVCIVKQLVCILLKV